MTHGRGPGIGVVILLACLFGLGAGVGGAWLYMRTAAARAPEQPTVVTARPATPSGAAAPAISVDTGGDAIVRAAAIAGPAAVKVETVHRRESNAWEFLFGVPYSEQRGIGSGFIFEHEGKKYVLSNTHVVTDGSGNVAREIDILLPDGRTMEGKLAGLDASQDIACIGLDHPPADTPTVTLGDSDALRVGEWVLAIGNPFNFEHSVTVGVVSAMGPRPIGEDRNRDLIQTDAAINQGNSGGPLINLAGQVVGINTMIYSRTGDSIGIGFAIPINQAKELLYYLVHRGPWIGVTMYPNNRGRARFYDLPTHEGVIIAEVSRGGPAAKAGLRPFDVVTHVDGQAVNTPEEMQRGIRKHIIGETTALTVARSDGTKRFSVKTGQIPDGYVGR